MNRISRLPSKLIKIMAVLIAGVFVCLSFLFGVGLEGVRYSNPSKSARAAKWSRAYLRHVELSPVEPMAKNGFSPKEAWLESIYENKMTFSLLPKKVAGVRLCVRFDYSQDKAIRSGMMLHDLEMTINGTSPVRLGGSSDGTGFTFEFSPDPSSVSPVSSGVFPEEGELTFFEKTKQIESRFHYSIK